jgi:hypothetical protein
MRFAIVLGLCFSSRIDLMNTRTSFRSISSSVSHLTASAKSLNVKL